MQFSAQRTLTSRPVINRRRKRQVMFDRGAEAWRRFSGSMGDVYICPICGRRFPPDQITNLTMEHVPPRSIGGKELVLTCRTCNNVVGHSTDAEAARRAEYRELGHAIFQRVGQYAGPVRITLGGIPLNGEISADEHGVRISVPVVRNDPRNIEALTQTAILRAKISSRSKWSQPFGSRPGLRCSVI